MHHCSSCKTTLAEAAFYRTVAGGPMHICKECHKMKMKINRLTNPAVQERERLRAKTPERKAASRRISVRWRQEHPEAYQAQTAVGNALRDGKITKHPCFICGTEKHVHAHHKDYRKPLQVTWLCAKCHHRLHSAFPELGGHHSETSP